MKKYIIPILTGAILLTTSMACTDLSEHVYSDLLLQDFLTSEEAVLMNAGRAYTLLQPYPEEQCLWSLNECASDELVIPQRSDGLYWDAGRWNELHTHNFTATNKINRLAWEYVYEGISGCNEVLYETENSSIDFEGKDKIIAEIKVLRCLFYYWATDNWGNIPFSVDYTATTLPPQKNRQFMYDYLVNEITTDIDALEEMPSSDYYGRVTKGMAYTLLAKIYLNAEEWIGVPKYAEAVDACNKVIALNAYSIEDDYFTNFKIYNESSKENIFVIPMQSNYTKDHFYWYTLSLNASSKATFNFIGEPWDGFVCDPTFFTKYSANDVRIKSFLFGQQYDSNGKPIYTVSGTDTTRFIYTPTIANYRSRKPWEGARICKYEYQQNLEYDVNDMENDFVIFRYADVLYTKLEALWRLGRAGEFINDPSLQKIRTRAGLTPYTVADLTSGEFLNELGREFAWEGHRRQDQIRFGVFENSGWNKSATSVSDKLFPIPQTVLNTNTNLVQNNMNY